VYREFDPSVVPPVGSLDPDVESVGPEESCQSVSDLFGSVLGSCPQVDVEDDAYLGGVVDRAVGALPPWDASTSSLIVAVVSGTIWAHGPVAGHWILAAWSGESLSACAEGLDVWPGGPDAEGHGGLGEDAVGIGEAGWLVAVVSSEDFRASASEVVGIGDVVGIGERDADPISLAVDCILLAVLWWLDPVAVESIGTVRVPDWEESHIAHAVSPLAVGVFDGGALDVEAEVVPDVALESGESGSADAEWWPGRVGVWHALGTAICPPASEWSDRVSCIVEWSPACRGIAVRSRTSLLAEALWTRSGLQADLVVWAPEVVSASWVDVVGDALDSSGLGDVAGESGRATVGTAGLSVLDQTALEDCDEWVWLVTVVTLAGNRVGGGDGV
jgi:hypothetical protein